MQKYVDIKSRLYNNLLLNDKHRFISATSAHSGTASFAQNFNDHRFSDNKIGKWDSDHSVQAVILHMIFCDHGCACLPLSFNGL